MKRQRRPVKKVGWKTVLLFAAVYLIVGLVLHLIWNNLGPWKPVTGYDIAYGLSMGLGLLVGRQLVWAIEWFFLGRTL